MTNMPANAYRSALLAVSSVKCLHGRVGEKLSESEMKAVVDAVLGALPEPFSTQTETFTREQMLAGTMLDKIEALAKAAAQDSWGVDDNEPQWVVNIHGTGIALTYLDKWHVKGPAGEGLVQAEANSRYIARMDPPTALGLVSEIRRLRAENPEIRHKALEEAVTVASDFAPATQDMRSTEIADVCDEIAAAIRSLQDKAKKGDAHG